MCGGAGVDSVKGLRCACSIEKPGKYLIENFLERNNELAKRENMNSYIVIVVDVTTQCCML